MRKIYDRISFNNELTLLLKLLKSANPPEEPPPPPENGSLSLAPKNGSEVGLGLGVPALNGSGDGESWGCVFGGAGRGGRCLLFFGGSAGLGLSGLGGGPPPGCNAANGSQPNGSLPDNYKNEINKFFLWQQHSQSLSIVMKLIKISWKNAKLLWNETSDFQCNKHVSYWLYQKQYYTADLLKVLIVTFYEVTARLKDFYVLA